MLETTNISTARIASQELAHSSLFKFESLLLAVTTSAAFAVNATNAGRLLYYKLLDPSIKLVLIALGLTAAATMLRYVVTYVAYTVFLLTNNFELAFVTDIPLCHIPAAIEMCPAVMLLCGPLLLCVTQNRILKALDEHKVGRSDRSSPSSYKFTVKALLILLLYSGLSAAAMLTMKPGEVELPLCDPLITMNTTVQMFAALTNLFLVLLAIGVLRKNQKLIHHKMAQYTSNRSDLTVDQRVQIHRSHKLNKAIMPGLAVQSVIYSIFMSSTIPTRLLVDSLAHRVMMSTFFGYTMISVGALAVGLSTIKILNAGDKVNAGPAGGHEEHRIRMQELDKVWCVEG